MSKRYRSRAVLGDEIDEAFGNVHEGIIRVQVRREADIWQGLSDRDPIQPLIDRAIVVAETVCRPILERSQNSNDA